jgi:hypothetical protein
VANTLAYHIVVLVDVDKSSIVQFPDYSAVMMWMKYVAIWSHNAGVEVLSNGATTFRETTQSRVTFGRLELIQRLITPKHLLEEFKKP